MTFNATPLIISRTKYFVSPLLHGLHRRCWRCCLLGFLHRLHGLWHGDERKRRRLAKRLILQAALRKWNFVINLHPWTDHNQTYQQLLSRLRNTKLDGSVKLIKVKITKVTAQHGTWSRDNPLLRSSFWQTSHWQDQSQKNLKKSRVTSTAFNDLQCDASDHFSHQVLCKHFTSWPSWLSSPALVLLASWPSSSPSWPLAWRWTENKATCETFDLTSCSEKTKKRHQLA